MYHLLSKEAVIAVETRDHLSNGVSPKDQMSRGNNLRKVLYCLTVVVIATIALISCNKEETHKKYLNGLWKIDDSYCVEIKKQEGHLVLFDAEYWAQGISRYVNVGDKAFRSLKKEDDNRWSGEELYWEYNEYDQVVGTAWVGVTIILSKDKKSFVSSSNVQKITYYKVNDVQESVEDRIDFKSEPMLKKGIKGVAEAHSRVTENQ